MWSTGREIAAGDVVIVWQVSHRLASDAVRRVLIVNSKDQGTHPATVDHAWKRFQ